MKQRRSGWNRTSWSQSIALVACLALAVSCAGVPSEEGSAVEAPAVDSLPEVESVQSLELQSLSGYSVPFPLADVAVATVVVFVRTDCPISNRYAPELAKIADEFSERGVRFVTAYVDPRLETAAIAEHFASYALPGHPVHDAEHKLVRYLSATVTPEAFVLSPDGEIQYRGRIDNRYVTFGKTRPEATEHDLHDVLTALAAGRSIEFAQTEPVGCFIADLEGAL